jgi:DNA-cytosine methyltransferase
MIIHSYFDGLSGGQIALNRAGIKYSKYYASEIDKYAIKITQANYPDTIQLGSITEWQSWDIEKPDLILAGFPCQPYSVAGKREGLNDKRGGDIVKCMIESIAHYKPDNFMLENVPGLLTIDSGNTFKHILGELNQAGFAVDWTIINSALVSAQNRNRLYIIGRRLDLCSSYKIALDQNNKRNYNFSLFDDSEYNIITFDANIPQPKDKGILLKDIIESATTDKDKSYCIDTNYYKDSSVKNYQDKSRRQMVVTGGAMRGRDSGQELEFNNSGKSNAITTVSKDSLCIQVGTADINGNDNIKRVYSGEGKCPTLTAVCGGNQEPKIATGITWRKLTPVECERLQTIDDNYTNHVSNSRRYHALGNSFTVDVIAHILSFMI